ncbi:MAG: hypothetical protein ABSF90_24495 [Syntrophobacteraceae bacterium]|jgi:hypothetical protein
MTKKVRVTPNLAIAGPFRNGAAGAPSEERCADLHAITDLSMTRGAALCLTRLRVWQKSRARGGSLK